MRLEEIIKNLEDDLKREGIKEDIRNQTINFIKDKYEIFFSELVNDKHKEDHAMLSYFANLSSDKIRNFGEFLSWYATLTQSWYNHESNKELKRVSDVLFQTCNRAYNRFKEDILNKFGEGVQIPEEDCAIFPILDKLSPFYGKTVRDGGMFVDVAQRLPNDDNKEFVAKVYVDKEEIKKERDFQNAFHTLFGEGIIKLVDYSEHGSVLTYPREEKDYSDISDLNERARFELSKSILSRVLDMNLSLTDYKINPSKMMNESQDREDAIRSIIRISEQNKELFNIDKDNNLTGEFLRKEFYCRIAKAMKTNLDDSRLDITIDKFSNSVIEYINQMPKLMLHGDFDPRNVIQSREDGKNFYIHDFKPYFGPYTFDIFEFLEKTCLPENGEYGKYNLLDEIIKELNNKAQEKGMSKFDKDRVRKDYDLTRVMMGLREASMFFRASKDEYENERNKEQYKKIADNFYTLSLRKLEEYGLNDISECIKSDINLLFGNALSDLGKLPEILDTRACASRITGGFSKALAKKARVLIRENKDLKLLVEEELRLLYGKSSPEDAEPIAKLLGMSLSPEMITRRDVHKFIEGTDENILSLRRKGVKERYSWLKDDWKHSLDNISFYSKEKTSEMLGVSIKDFDKHYNKGQLPIIKKDSKFAIVWQAIYEIGHIGNHIFYSPERISQILGIDQKTMVSLYHEGKLPIAENLGYFRIIGGTKDYNDIEDNHPDLRGLAVDEEYINIRKKISGHDTTIIPPKVKGETLKIKLNSYNTDCRIPFLKYWREKGAHISEDLINNKINIEIDGKIVQVEKPKKINTNSYRLKDDSTFSELLGYFKPKRMILPSETIPIYKKCITTTINLNPGEKIIEKEGKKYFIGKNNKIELEVKGAELLMKPDPLREFIYKNKNSSEVSSLCYPIENAIKTIYDVIKQLKSANQEIEDAFSSDFILKGKVRSEDWDWFTTSEISEWLDNRKYWAFNSYRRARNRKERVLVNIGFEELEKAGFKEDYKLITETKDYFNKIENFRKDSLTYIKEKYTLRMGELEEALKSDNNKQIYLKPEQEKNSLHQPYEQMADKICEMERVYYIDRPQVRLKEQLEKIQGKYQTLMRNVAEKWALTKGYKKSSS